VLVEPFITTPNVNVVRFITAKWLIILPGADEIHLMVILIDVVVVVFVTVALVVPLIAQVMIVVVIILEGLEVVDSMAITFILLLVNYVRLLLVLHLENSQPIKFENIAHFNKELLLNFDLFFLGKDFDILIVNYSEGGPILKAKIHERFIG